MVMRSVSENNRDFFLMMVPLSQTDRLQCETVETSGAKHKRVRQN